MCARPRADAGRRCCLAMLCACATLVTTIFIYFTLASQLSPVCVVLSLSLSQRKWRLRQPVTSPLSDRSPQLYLNTLCIQVSINHNQTILRTRIILSKSKQYKCQHQISWCDQRLRKSYPFLSFLIFENQQICKKCLQAMWTLDENTSRRWWPFWPHSDVKQY